MKIRLIAIAATALAAVVPALSIASASEEASVNACARAFATRLNPSAAATSPVKVVYHSGQHPNSVADFYPMEYTFDLEARDANTGSSIARVRCETTARGTVRTLAALPSGDVATPTAR